MKLDNCIIPIPKKSFLDDKFIKVKAKILTDKKDWELLVYTFCECMEKIFDMKITEGEGGIIIAYDESVAKEAYRFVADSSGMVSIYASDYQGAAYGIATLVQLAKPCESMLEFQCGSIEDMPDKDYRGLMVDVARKWHPFSSLLHYVDLCFFYKIKYLHIHFMDNESYTLPSKAFPKLPTQNRSYSFKEIRTLCDYAKSRGVTLVPELEMPGHAMPLNQAYPELFSNTIDEAIGEDLITENGVVISEKSILCGGSEATFESIKKLIDETMDMFTDFPYIHLGGDEVNLNIWNSCSECIRYIKEHNLKDVEELYCEFTARVTNYVLEKGKTPIVWEGFPKKYSDKISKNVIVIGWECHYQNPDELIDGGYQVINCTWQPLYVVPHVNYRWGISDILKWNVYEWQHFWEKSNATLNPFHIPETEQVIGAQLCSWELTYEQEIARVVENLAALSERTWSVKRYRSDESFIAQYHFQSIKAYALIAEK